MKDIIEKRRSFIINFLYFGIIIGLFYFIVNHALAYVFPFVFAGALAIVLQPLVRTISKKLKLKAHGVVSLILVLLIVSVIVLALVLALSKLFGELRSFVDYLLSQFKSVADVIAAVKDSLNDILLKLPGGIGAKANVYVENWLSKISESGGGEFDFSVLSAPIEGAWSVVKGIPSVILSIVVTIISCVFMTSEYDIIRDMILDFCSEEKGKKLVNAKQTMVKGVGKLIKAYVTIMFITFCEVFLGLNLMRLIGVYDGGYIPIIAFVVCIVDIIPVLGTGTVLIPWAIYSLVTGNIGLGIGLIILYAVITVLRQAIEPKLVANQVGLPSIVTIIAMFLGGRLFGVFGVILLPLTVIVLKLMLDEGIIGKKSREPQIVEVAATENSEESESISDNEAE